MQGAVFYTRVGGRFIDISQTFLSIVTKVFDQYNKISWKQWQSVDVKAWIPNPGVPCSKPLGGSYVDSAFYSSEVDKMSTMNP